MLRFLAGPFVLHTREQPIETEAQFRKHLDPSWASGLFHNLIIERNSQTIAEYDAVLWDHQGALFLEYKDSRVAYRNLGASGVQRLHDISRNVARALGFNHFSFKVVLNGASKRSQKGGCEVIPLHEMPNYVPEWENTLFERDILDRVVRRNREFLRKTGLKGDPEGASFDSGEGDMANEANRIERINKDLAMVIKLLEQD